MSKPISKAAQIRHAEKVLLTLLRTPKSRNGLVAAVKTKTISRNYVFGFLSAGKRTGQLTTHKSGPTVMYQVATATAVVEETPQTSDFPSWLDPRSLPVSRGRVVVIDGAIVKITEK